MPPNSSPTFTPHTPTSLVQLLVYKPCSVFSFLLLCLTLFKKKFYYYNYSCSDSTAFCIASISSAPNSPSPPTNHAPPTRLTHLTHLIPLIPLHGTTHPCHHAGHPCPSKSSLPAILASVAALSFLPASLPSPS